MPHADDDRWFWRPRPRANAQYRLFCLPFAGGGPRVFQGWDDWLEPDIELIGVRLPGRENRLGEAAFTDWPTLLDSTAAALEPWLDRPFAVLGHSFGGQLAWELAGRWCALPNTRLRLVGISACTPPHHAFSQPGLARFERGRFFDSLARGGGMPPEALANEEFKTLFEPTLRADMGLAEAWHELDRSRVTVPVVAFAGVADSMAPPEAVREWSRYVEAGFRFAELEGGHFYLRERADRMLATLTAALRAHSASV